VVDVRTDPHVGRTGVLIPVGTDFLISKHIQNGSGLNPASASVDTGGSCPGIKRPARDGDHLSPSSTELEIE